MSRYFTLDQATALLPKVERHLRDALFAYKEHQEAQEAFSEFQKQIQFAGGTVVNRDRITKIVARRNASAMILKQEMEALETIGVQVKDLEIGLIDFPTMYEGEEVLLCWKLGEEGITYWHGLTEGFRGRKPIDGEFIARHRGDSEN